MADAARYWRIGVRDNSGTYNAHIPFATLKVFNTAGTELSSTATITATSLVTVGTLPNLYDNDNTSLCGMLWSNDVASSFKYFTYDFTTPVLLDSFLVRVSSTASGATNRVLASRLDFVIQSSSNNVNWVSQAVYARPLLLEDTDYRLGTNVDSLYYPLPDRTQLGGTGGIYGIVSEDGTALPNRPVVLLDRDSFQKIGYTTTDTNGGYAFNGLNENREYTVFSVDPSGPPYKNALIWDRIQPINTKGALIPQSPFWARRLRDSKFGFAAALAGFLDGAGNNYARSASGATGEIFPTIPGRGDAQYVPANGFDGMTLDATDGAQGAFAFLASNRTVSNNGTGLHFLGSGVFSNNVGGDTNNYAALSFEYVFIPPTAGEGQLIMVWAGTEDSTDNAPLGFWGGAGAYAYGVGHALQVTSSDLYVRFNLGGANANTVRAQASVTQGQVHHVVVTYSQDTEIKLYVNGSLIQTVSIAGAGRLFNVPKQSNTDLITNWNTNPYGGATGIPGFTGAVRRITSFHVLGNGLQPDATGNGLFRMIGPGWGGRFGMSAVYGRVLSATDVTNLRDSLINTSTHTVLTTQSGYMGEVEADNPTAYYRLNELSAPAVAPRPLLGRRDLPLVYRVGTTYGATGFVSGSTAVDFSNSGGAWAYDGLGNSAFTAEMFIRPTSLAALGYLFATRVVNNANWNPILALTLSTAGALVLSVTDPSNTVTTFAFSHTALVTNTSYHIAVTYDPWNSKKARLYINGVMVSELAAATIPNSGMAQWASVGCLISQNNSASFSDHFRGVMGEFAWYNYELSAARLLAHYDARNA